MPGQTLRSFSPGNSLSSHLLKEISLDSGLPNRNPGFFSWQDLQGCRSARQKADGRKIYFFCMKEGKPQSQFFSKQTGLCPKKPARNKSRETRLEKVQSAPVNPQNLPLLC